MRQVAPGDRQGTEQQTVRYDTPIVTVYILLFSQQWKLIVAAAHVYTLTDN